MPSGNTRRQGERRRVNAAVNYFRAVMDEAPREGDELRMFADESLRSMSHVGAEREVC